MAIRVEFVNGINTYPLRVPVEESIAIEDFIRSIQQKLGLSLAIGSLRVNNREALPGQLLVNGDSVESIKRAGDEG